MPKHDRLTRAGPSCAGVPLVVARALSEADRAACLAIRLAVFVAEQGVPAALEADRHDETALHYLGCVSGQAAATARVLLRPDGTGAKLGRIAVAARFRGHGHGAALMRAVEADPALAGRDRLVLEAQTQAIGFYQRLGYTAHGPVFMDAGLPHRAMEKRRS